MCVLGVVNADPLGDDPFGLEAVRQLVQVDGFVFERSPQAFNKNIVHEPAPAIHGDADAGILERAGEVEAGKPAALVGVEDFRFAVSGQRRVVSRDAEPDFNAVR